MTGTIENRSKFLETLFEKRGGVELPFEPYVPISDLPETHLAHLTTEELLDIAKEQASRVSANLIETSSFEMNEVIRQLIEKSGGGQVMIPSTDEFEKLGIIFTDTDSGLRDYPEIFKKYFSKLVPPTDNKLAALNSAVWSGGSFVYVPKGVKCEIPIQAYFRINNEKSGQFERTLIIVEEGASIQYVEGCTAPTYSASSLHAAVVEIFVEEGGYMRYSTIQNWSDNVYNLVTKRAAAEKNATVEWIDGNLGSKVSMKYPAVHLNGPGARGTMLSIAFAGANQNQDTGAKMIHNAPNTSSSIISKSIAKNGGAVNYRGQVTFGKNSKKSASHIECDTILMDDLSKSDTVPFNEIHNSQVALEHEAKVSKISEEQLYYLMSRGLTEKEATDMIVMGFIEPFTKELPMEYAVELNRLISYSMEGSIG
ncbi:MAG TPA: Fe-S cluster assembly protein SufB [Lactococcus lactis]|nr:Fe-S cluster assembly protein SufB [Lactococcus lactis]